MRAIPTDAKLDEVIKSVSKIDGIMMPVKRKDVSSPWAQLTKSIVNVIDKMISASPYKAYAGVFTGLHQIYYVIIKDKFPSGLLLVTNPVESGQKKKVKQIEAKIEPELVYPLLRGKNVKKWYAKCASKHIILPHDPTGRPIRIDHLKLKYPHVWEYFLSYYDALINRSGGFFKSRLKNYRTLSLNEAAKISVPFYSVTNNVAAALSPYKVVWKRIAGAITGKAVSFASAVVEPLEDKWLGVKPVIPDDSLILVPCNSAEEAYYLAGVLNSTPVRFVIASYTYELRQETHILEFVRIPKYEGKPLQKEIAELSRKAHQVAKQIYEEKKEYLKDELRSIEDKIDKLVAKLYDISNEELSELRKAFAILAGEELEEVETAEEPPKEIIIDFPKNVLTPNVEESLIVSLINPENRKLKIEITLPDGQVKSFETLEKEETKEISIKPLKPGEYEIKYKVIDEDGKILKEDSIKITVEQVRRFRR